MSEIQIWLSAKDNPQMTEAEIRAENEQFNKTVNGDTQDKINTDWNRMQGPKRPEQP